MAAAPTHSTSTSRSLLSRVRADDDAAWSRLVSLYAPLVFSWCRRSHLSEQDANDVFQEVFGAVAANIGRFRKQAPGDTFRGWLRTVTRNKIHDHGRRLVREPRAIGGSDAQMRLAQVAQPEALVPGNSTAAVRGLYQRALELIQSEFQENTWRAFWRTAVDGQPAGDVAAELSMRAGAVRVAKCRVLQRLREELGDVVD